MNQEHIEKMLVAALTEAASQSIPIAVAIVDNGGHLVAFRRTEGCSFFGIEASRNKAITASQLKTPTHILAEIAQKVPELQAALSKNPLVLTLVGGFPIIQSGVTIGGLGVSGGDFIQDKTIGEKALQAIAL